MYLTWSPIVTEFKSIFNGETSKVKVTTVGLAHSDKLLTSKMASFRSSTNLLWSCSLRALKVKSTLPFILVVNLMPCLYPANENFTKNKYVCILIYILYNEKPYYWEALVNDPIHIKPCTYVVLWRDIQPSHIARRNLWSCMSHCASSCWRSC